MPKPLRAPTAAGIVIGLLVVAALWVAHLPEQAEVVIATAQCTALTQWGKAVRTFPGGCLYAGPVRRSFRYLVVDGIRLPHSAILAERAQPKGASHE